MDWSRILFGCSCCFGLLLGLVPTTASAQLREFEGRFIRLTTDLDSQQEAEDLVASFDAAVPQWVEFWKLSLDQLASWRVHACVIRDKAKFQNAGLIPAQLPEFSFGYAYGPDRIWVLTQQSEYYTRHLLLHEGVHSLVISQFGWTGPTWFREGMAELLSTHRGVGDDVVIKQVPRSREDVPYWGRFKRMSQIREEGSVPTLSAVMAYQPNLLGDVTSYGWSWAAAMMLDAYPEYQDELLAAARFARGGPGFNRRFMGSLRSELPILAARWRMMCHDLDYGFDWSRERVELSIQDPIWNGQPIELKVAANRGWQSLGVRIPKNTTIRVTADGRVQLAETTKPWISEPAGITFQYYRERPIGELLACVLPNQFDPQAKKLPPLDIQPIGNATTLSVRDFSWLLFRVNDGVGDLGDNQDAYRVKIER